MYKANRINFKGPISTMTENRNVASDTSSNLQNESENLQCNHTIKHLNHASQLQAQRPELLGLIQPKNRCVIAKPK
eukprot:gene13061-8907_t